MIASLAPRRGLISGTAVLFIVLLLLAASSDDILAVDAAHAPRTLVTVGLFVTEFGTSGYMFAFSALIAAFAILAMARGQERWQGASLRLVAERALYFFAAIAVSGILAQIIKHIVGRSRPKLLASDGPFHFHILTTANAMASFPSGHTTSAFAAAVALGFMRPAWHRPLLAAAILIGLSRVLVGAHFPSDVVAGAALGSVVSLLLARDFARRGLAFMFRQGRPVMEPLRPVSLGSRVRT